MKTIENFKLEVVLRILNAFKEDEIAILSQLSTYTISDEVIKISTKHLHLEIIPAIASLQDLKFIHYLIQIFN